MREMLRVCSLWPRTSSGRRPNVWFDVAQEGLSHFEVRFTGPAGQELLPDFYRLCGGPAVFSLFLEPIARDLRFVHYVATLSEATTHEVPLAG